MEHDDFVTVVEYNGNTDRWEIYNTFTDTTFPFDFATEREAIDYLKVAFFYHGAGFQDVA